MIKARRKDIGSIELPGEHAGLALDTLLASQEDEEISELLNSISEASFGGNYYQQGFERWKKALEAVGALFFEAETVSSLAIGLGNEAPLEVGLSLHRTYGLPYLPGSALKGLSRRVARRVNINEEGQKYFFGDADYAGAMIFWDAWMIPECKKPFKRDVITVHHQNYYSRKGAENTLPTDFDKPIPIPFLTVRPGTRFIVALSAPSSEWKDWVEVTQQLLIQGLEEEGLGAKTNSGYGRFKCTEIETGISKAIYERINDLKGPQEIGPLIVQLEELSSEDQSEIAILLKEKLIELKWWKNKNKDKAAYKWIAERTGE